MKEGFVLPINPPPVQGLGLRAGFEFQLQDRGGRDAEALADATQRLLAAAAERPELARVNGTFYIASPQLFMELDILRAKTRGVMVDQVYESLQAFLGALYVNDFVKDGRIYRVQVQAEADYRQSASMIGKFYARNETGGMVPLSDLTSTEFQAGPAFISRFNAYQSVEITGEPAPGYSTGDTIRVMQELVEDLGPGWGYEWSGSSYQEIRAGKEAPYIVGLGLLVVFLVLAALYERWALPMVVLLGIPSGAFGAILAVLMRRYFNPAMANDIYFQIGLLTLIGLAAKNAILIVEFSSTLRERGMPIREAAVEAARVRLRPFIMTSLAFILGVLPLVIAEGAGAAGRHSIGTGVMGGMIAATVLDMFFVPLLFVLFQTMSERFSRKNAPDSSTSDPPLAVEPTLKTAE
jgi:hydrophobe/amphiphile efflux-1 (HAE1) family protein